MNFNSSFGTVAAAICGQLVDLPYDACRISYDNGAGRDVLYHHGAGSNKRPGADLHARQQRYIGADDRPGGDVRPFETRLGVGRQRIAGIGQYGPRTEPAPRFEHGVLGDEHVRVDAHAVADLDVMLDDRVAADADIVADAVGFADHDAVAALEVLTDDVA